MEREMRRVRCPKASAIAWAALLAAVVPGGCRGRGAQDEDAVLAVPLTSPAFAEGGRLPAAYTCDGAGISPPLAWGAVPQGTRTLALIVDDPDAPGGPWVHWVLYDLPPSTRALPQGAASAPLPAGT